MEYLTSFRRDGSKWIPEFVKDIMKNKCIGCGRCFKVCSHNVLNLSEYEDEDLDEVKAYMTIENGNNCIGCKSCSKTCPKSCFVHAVVGA